MDDEETEVFINAIQNRPELWKAGHPLHKNRVIIKRKWTEVSGIVGKGVDEVKKKWKSLRDQYRKEYKKKPLRRSGASREETEWVPQWKFFNMLNFLHDEIMPVHGTGNLQLPLQENSSQDNISASTESPPPSVSHDSLLLDDDNENTDISLSESAHSSRPRIAEQRQQMLKLEQEKIALIKSRIVQSKKEDELRADEDYLFLMSILPSMKRLSNIQKLRFRHKISEVILEMSSYNEYDNMFNNNNYSTPQSQPQYFTSNSANLPSTSTSSQPQYFTSDSITSISTSTIASQQEVPLPENENQEEEIRN